jgi:beta-glucanase (GH16 family)
MFLFRFSVILLLITASPCLLYAQSGSDNMLSLGNAIETLDQEFHQAPVWRQGAVQVTASMKPLNDPSFSWAAGYIWSNPPIGVKAEWPPSGKKFPAWTENNGADTDPNGDMIAEIGESRSPLTWSGTLHLTARVMPPDLAATIDKPRPYMSAAISSFPYAQLYGVYAISAKVPSGHGLWPAFWLVPADKSWPPEIDIMEAIGREPSTLYTTVHTNGPNGHTAKGQATDTHIDLSSAFHEYAVDWGPERINWYFDRKLVFSAPTPPDLHKPCYIIANLAVGTHEGWGGAPDDTTKLPASMDIAYIRIWQRLDYRAN